MPTRSAPWSPSASIRGRCGRVDGDLMRPLLPQPIGGRRATRARPSRCPRCACRTRASRSRGRTCSRARARRSRASASPLLHRGGRGFLDRLSRGLRASAGARRAAGLPRLPRGRPDDAPVRPAAELERIRDARRRPVRARRGLRRRLPPERAVHDRARRLRPPGHDLQLARHRLPGSTSRCSATATATSPRRATTRPGLYAVLTALGRLDFELIHRLRRLDGLPGPSRTSPRRPRW